MALWITFLQPGSDHPDCLSTDVQRGLVSHTINARRQTTGDDKTGLCQAAGKRRRCRQGGGDARRPPTMANCGFSRMAGSPATNSSGGASSSSASKAGYVAASHISKCWPGRSSQAIAAAAPSRISAAPRLHCGGWHAQRTPGGGRCAERCRGTTKGFDQFTEAPRPELRQSMQAQARLQFGGWAGRKIIAHHLIILDSEARRSQQQAVDNSVDNRLTTCASVNTAPLTRPIHGVAAKR